MLLEHSLVALGWLPRPKLLVWEYIPPGCHLLMEILSQVLNMLLWVNQEVHIEEVLTPMDRPVRLVPMMEH